MTAGPGDEKELIDRARAGDADAYGELVNMHQDRIYNAAYYLLSDREKARDVTQDVFLRAYEKLEGFRGEAKFGTWIYSIMLNMVRNLWRKRSRRSTMVRLDKDRSDEHEGGSPDPPSPRNGPFETMDRQERAELVREGIDRLKDPQKEVLVLRDIEGLPYDRIADVLDMPMGTVKSRLYRARESLKNELEPLFGEKSGSEAE
jgi:RNA polymerase sigma-70 factor (ECF subfamily)